MEAVQESRNNDDDCKGCCHYGGIFDTVLSMIKPERLASGIGALTATIGELVAHFCCSINGGKTKSAKLGAMSVTMVAMASLVPHSGMRCCKLASIDSGKTGFEHRCPRLYHGWADCCFGRAQNWW